MSLAEALKTYDPNITWATHTVELTYMVWGYQATASVQIGSYTKGAGPMKMAIDLHADKLLDEQGHFPVLILTKPGNEGEQDTLECTCDEYVRDSDKFPDIQLWLENMCVGIRILGQVAEERAPR